MTVRVVGSRELRDLSRELRRHADGKQRRKELTNRLRDAAKPIVPVVKGNIRALPSKGQSRKRGRRSLRAEMANSVQLQVKLGSSARVSIFMNPRKMSNKKKGLPGYFEKIPKKLVLRHPVFGNRDTWVAQQIPPQGYFTKSLGPVESRVISEIRRIVDDVKRDLEG